MGDGRQPTAGQSARRCRVTRRSPRTSHSAGAGTVTGRFSCMPIKDNHLEAVRAREPNNTTTNTVGSNRRGGCTKTKSKHTGRCHQRARTRLSRAREHVDVHCHGWLLGGFPPGVRGGVGAGCRKGVCCACEVSTVARHARLHGLHPISALGARHPALRRGGGGSCSRCSTHSLRLRRCKQHMRASVFEFVFV
jgi:hypothetical protein